MATVPVTAKLKKAVPLCVKQPAHLGFHLISARYAILEYITMRNPIGTLFAAVVVLVISVLLVPPLNAQIQQASCTFTLFTTPGTPNGVNDYGTTVGYATYYSPNTNQFTTKGFTRYTNGTVTYFQAPNAANTIFSGRNNAGVTVGSYSIQGPTVDTGFILNGSQFTSFSYPKAMGTTLSGINRYNTTVGRAVIASTLARGFKRFSNGTVVSLQYPGTSDTAPAAINDQGTIVGTAAGHGFIYHAGTWARVDYPNSGGGRSINGMALLGISNNNVIVGEAFSSPPTSFLYVNGVFKTIMAPNSTNTQVQGISPNGLITGIAYPPNGPGRGFLATCK
jgi:hypothetical protein